MCTTKSLKRLILQSGSTRYKMRFNSDLPDYLKIMMLRPGRLNYNGLGDKDPMIQVALADMLLETNFLSDSVAEYKKAIALLPNDQQLRSYQMHVLSKKGDWAAAAQENLALSQQIVNSIPKSVEEWQRGKQPQKSPHAQGTRYGGKTRLSNEYR